MKMWLTTKIRYGRNTLDQYSRGWSHPKITMSNGPLYIPDQGGLAWTWLEPIDLPRDGEWRREIFTHFGTGHIIRSPSMSVILLKSLRLSELIGTWLGKEAISTGLLEHCIPCSVTIKQEEVCSGAQASVTKLCLPPLLGIYPYPILIGNWPRYSRATYIRRADKMTPNVCL